MLVAPVVVAAALGFWAARVTLQPRVSVSSGPTTAAVTLVPVRVATVGKQISLSTTVVQDPRVVAHNMLSGIVTSTSPGRHQSGDIIYTVGNTPVRVVAGASPFFRDLSLGAQGEDVQELTDFLISQRLLTMRTNYFNSAVRVAVDEWHRKNNEALSGAIPLGTLIAVPSLPAQIMLGDQLVTAGMASQGEGSISVPAASKKFVLRVSPDQAQLIPTGAPVAITFNDKTWHAVTGGAVASDDQSSATLTLTGEGQGPICGADCDLLPATSSLTLPSQITITKPATGPSVPTAAISTDARGQTFVTLETGQHVSVTIKSTGGGLAVVEGVNEGQRVRLAALPGANG